MKLSYRSPAGFHSASRSHGLRLALVFLAMLQFPIANAQYSQVSGPSYVYSLHREKVAHIEIVGELYNGETELANVGSGVRMSSEYVLTSAHLFKDISNYRSVTINVRLGHRQSQPYVASIADLDEENDLSLLQFDDPATVRPTVNCPMYIVNDARFIPGGSELYFLGYPLDRPYGIAPGLMRSDPTAIGPWETTASLNPGNSGGPGFNWLGYFVGIAKGAPVAFERGGQSYDVDGISYFVASTTILSSRIGKTLLDAPAEGACAVSEQARFDGTFGLDMDKVPLAERSEQLAITYTVEVAATDEKRDVRKYYQAVNGYRIDDCQLELISDLIGQSSCTIEDEGAHARLDFVTTASSPDDREEYPAARLYLSQIRIPENL